MAHASAARADHHHYYHHHPYYYYYYIQPPPRTKYLNARASSQAGMAGDECGSDWEEDKATYDFYADVPHQSCGLLLLLQRQP